MAKQVPVVPDGFATLIDTLSGVDAATDQEAYDAAEARWASIQDL